MAKFHFFNRIRKYNAILFDAFVYCKQLARVHAWRVCVCVCVCTRLFICCIVIVHLAVTGHWSPAELLLNRCQDIRTSRSRHLGPPPHPSGSTPGWASLEACRYVSSVNRSRKVELSLSEGKYSFLSGITMELVRNTDRGRVRSGIIMKQCLRCYVLLLSSTAARGSTGRAVCRRRRARVDDGGRWLAGRRRPARSPNDAQWGFF